MKRRLFSLLLLIFLAPGTAFATNGVLVKETSSLGWKMFSDVEAETVLNKGPILTFCHNVKVFKPLGANERGQKIEVDTSTRQYRVLETHVFVKERAEFHSLTPSQPAKGTPVKDKIDTALQYNLEDTGQEPVPPTPTAVSSTGASQPTPNQGATGAAAKLFTTTILGTTVQQVQDVIIEVMTRENYTLEEVDDNKVIMGKQGPSVLFMPGPYSRVRFNILPRDGNIRLMVNQVDSQGPQSMQQTVAHLVPLIREIRNRLDGTPKEQITNETATTTSGPVAPAGKSLGIRLGEKNGEGFIVIERVEPGSKAAEAGLNKLDILLEVNGRSTKEFDVKGLQAYLEEKWGQRASILLIYSREGETEIATIKE